MLEFDIRSKEFGGLMLTIIADREGVQDAMFSSSRNQLPEKMYRRLVDNQGDINQIWEAIEEERG